MQCSLRIRIISSLSREENVCFQIRGGGGEEENERPNYAFMFYFLFLTMSAAISYKLDVNR